MIGTQTREAFMAGGDLERIAAIPGISRASDFKFI